MSYHIFHLLREQIRGSINHLRTHLLPAIACSLGLATALALLPSCRPYTKEVPSGRPLQLQQVYANPSYDYTKLARVALLPLENPRSERSIFIHQNQLELKLLSNFSKRGDIDLYPVDPEKVSEAQVISLEANRIDRFLTGNIGNEFNAQGILYVSCVHFHPYPPMQMHLKALMVDTQTGERIWSVDQVFDQNDANVINGMRHWWNGQRAGGLSVERFEVSSISTNSFADYCFFCLANSFTNERIKNRLEITKLAQRDSLNKLRRPNVK
jgi:hypothetical protein